VCKDKEAEALLLKALKLEDSVNGPESYLTSMRLFELAWLYYDHGRYDKAIQFFQRALDLVTTHDSFVRTRDPIPWQMWSGIMPPRWRTSDVRLMPRR
jgi:tetratricopeptide (TPR) repeat protein